MVSHRECEEMTTLDVLDEDYVDRAKVWTTLLEDLEAKRSGRNVSEARVTVASHLRVAPGTLANLRNRNPKTIKTSVYQRVRNAVIRALGEELSRVEHTRQVAIQSGLDPRSGEMQSISSRRSLLREALGLTDGATP